MSMAGKRVVVTGATKGIGRETALALGKMGAELVLVVRDPDRGREVAREIGGQVDVLTCDLSSTAEVKRVAAEILSKHDRVDVLVNNAGALLMKRELTKEGHEATFATNHLAYFVLTNELLPALKKAPEARVVNVASEAHRRGSIRFDDLMGEKNWSGLFAYGSSKLANILFTAELARRLEGTSVTTNALHPGVVASGFGRNNKGLVGVLWGLASPFLLSNEKGAKTTIFLATEPSIAGVSGKYFAKCKEKKPSREARDADVAKRLWAVSEELTK
jgi:NAD(P)-dependent dehydrogenase (short-subunit alcohol dehydrogenase family)